MLPRFSTVLFLTALCALIPSRVEAEFNLVTDAADFASNDLARWGPSSFGGLNFPLVSETFGVRIPWHADTHSIPRSNSVVRWAAGSIFIGTNIDPPFRPDHASFDLGLDFSPDGPFVLGVFAGFDFSFENGTGENVLTATDSLGNSQSFDIPDRFRGFLGIESDVPLSHLQLFSDHTGTSTVFVGNLSLDVVTPTPPSWALLLSALPVLAWRARRWGIRQLV